MVGNVGLFLIESELHCGVTRYACYIGNIGIDAASL